MAQGLESRDSVFDFVYVDSKRITLYLTQMSGFGSLTSLVHSSQESDQSKQTIGPRVLQAEAVESQQTTTQKHYDTQWVAPLSLLEELQHRDMIKHTFEDVRLGDIFILPGELSLIDIGMFARVWGVVADQQIPSPAPSGNRHFRRAEKAQGQPPVVPVNQPGAATGLRIMGALDQPLFVNFHSKGRRFWAIGESGYVIGDAGGLALKHGIAIQGTWHLLAILDAMPEAPAQEVGWLARLCGDGVNMAGTQLIDILAEFGKILGRPDGCYGITPLAIFREIGAKVT